MKFSFIHRIRFRVDNVVVFQRVSMNLKMRLIYSKHVGCFLC